METWRIVEVVLVSVLVGAMLPVALQAWATLRMVRLRLEKSADRLDHALEGVSVTVARLNRITEPLDDGKRIRELIESVDRLAKTVDHIRERAQLVGAIGAAVAPAVVAAIRAIRTPAPGDGAPTAELQEESAEPPSVFTERKEVAS